jgi:hypothetical protein
VTIEPRVRHNVYLPNDAIIHTVKQGQSADRDWHPAPSLNALTRKLSESEVQTLAKSHRSKSTIDERFSSYVAIYNNFDNIIWKMPAFFAAAIGVVIALFANIVSRAGASLPLGLWTLVFLLIGLLLTLGTYSLARVRQHHTIMGRHLRKLEPEGYFHERQHTLGNWKLPAAPIVFIYVFAVLSVLFLAAAAATAMDVEFVRTVLRSKISTTP